MPKASAFPAIVCSGRYPLAPLWAMISGLILSFVLNAQTLMHDRTGGGVLQMNFFTGLDNAFDSKSGHCSFMEAA
jgi:hypothetical protein